MRLWKRRSGNGSQSMTAEQRAAVERSEGSHVTAQELRDEARVIESPDTTLGPQIRSYVAAHFRAAADEIERLSPPSDDDLPVTEEWLRSVGFQDDRAGCPTLSALHIQTSDESPLVPYACVRSFPIPIPQARGDVRRLCSALGIDLAATR